MARRRSRPSSAEKNMGLLSPTGHVSAQALDYFLNQAARIGYGSQSLPEAGEYTLHRLSYDYVLLYSIYRNQFLCRRIVDIPAEDMVRAWPKVSSEMEPDDEARIDKAVRKTGTKSQVLTGLKWGRLFGGAGCLIVIDGHEDRLDQPLDLDDVGIGSYRGLCPFDMWAGITPSGTQCTDINRPLDFNKPESYTVRAQGGESFEVHASRIMRFTGPEVPTPEREAQMLWGISVLEPAYEIIRMFDTLLYSVLNLTMRANLIGLKFPDLAEALSGLGNSQLAAQNWEKRLGAMNHLMSNQSLIPLPKDGGLESTQYSFSGLDTVFQTFQLNVCSAAGIPMTRLWGRTMSGIGQTGEGDEKIYEEKIATDQEYMLRPALEKLYPVICMSELGEVPDDLSLDFPSIRVMDEKDKAELGKSVVDTVTVALNSGAISLRTYAKELKALGPNTGMFTNLTDEDIEKLPDTPQNEGEMGGDLFGEEPGGEPQLEPAESPQKVLREEGEQRKTKERLDDVESKLAFARDGVFKTKSFLPGERAKAERYAAENGLWLLRHKKTGVLYASNEADRHDFSDLDLFEVVQVPPPSTRATDADGPVSNAIHWHGMVVVIETPKGEVRRGKGWSQVMPYDYGYLDGHPGADGDSLDVCMGPDPSSEWVYLFDQDHLPPRKGFDETKVLAGYRSAQDALIAFRRGHHRAGEVLRDWTPMNIAMFKQWLGERDPKKPAGRQS